MHTLSVVMTNYNHARFLPGALSAILLQSFQPVEIIIIDDASTDHSAEVLSEFSKRSPNLKVIQNERNLGIIANGRRLFDLAIGDYVYWAASDDKVLPGFFQKSMELLMRYPQAGLCSTLSVAVDEEGRYQGLCRLPVISSTACFLNPKQFQQAFCDYGSWLQGVTTIYRKQAILDAGGFPPQLGAFVDGFMCEVLALRHGVCFIPEPLTAMRRMGEYSMSAGANLETMLEITRQAESLMDSTYRDIFAPDCRRSVRRQLVHWAGTGSWNEVRRQQEKFLSQSFPRLCPSQSWIERTFLLAMQLFIRVQSFMVKCFFVGLVRRSPLVWLKFWVNYFLVWKKAKRIREEVLTVQDPPRAIETDYNLHGA